MRDQEASNSAQRLTVQETQTEVVDPPSTKPQESGPVTRTTKCEVCPGITLNNRYVLERELGFGGMGQVYLGCDTSLDRSVAIKVIRPRDPKLRDRSLHAANLRASFVEEARIGANLTHPAIATVFDFGFHDMEPFIVFEYIHGETLREMILRRGRFPLEEVRLIVGSLAQALDFAHSHHVVHRDLKPENIRATGEGHFKILDLGLAREFRQEIDWSFAGTPAYASPEQASSQPCDGRTDQYALALITHELLTGHQLFEGSTWSDFLRRHREEEPLSPLRFVPDIPESVCMALLRALMKDPNQRFESCEQFAVALGCPILNAPVASHDLRQLAAAVRMRGDWSSQRMQIASRQEVFLALTDDLLWAMYREEFRRWPLSAITDVRRNWWGKELHLRFKREGQVVSQAFCFSKRKECRQWCELLEEVMKSRSLDSAAQPTQWPPAAPDPVVLINRPPQMRYQVLGSLECQAPHPRLADAGLQVKAAMIGADAVVDIQKVRLPQMGSTIHQRSGVAIKAVDTVGRRDLRSRWFATQVFQLNRWMLILIFASFVLTLIGTCLSSLPSLRQFIDHNNTQFLGETVMQNLKLNALVVALIHVWPLAISMATRWLLWPQLLRPSGLAILALGSRTLLIPPACLAAGLIHGRWQFGLFESIAVLDPTNLAFLLFAVFLYRRACRLDIGYRLVAPDAEQQLPTNRKVGEWLAIITSVLYLLVLGSYQAYGTYAFVSNFAVPGSESWKRNEAISELNQGAIQTDKNLQAAETAFRRALPKWQALVDAAPQNPEDRDNLARTHQNLGAVQMRQGRTVEAVESLRQAMNHYEELSTNFPAYQKHKKNQESTQRSVTQLLVTIESEKRRQAAQKEYGEAFAQKDQNPKASEAAFRRALPLWQEIVDATPTIPETRYVLAFIHQNLSELLLRRGNTTDAEASLRQALTCYKDLEKAAPAYKNHKEAYELAQRVLNGLLESKPFWEESREGSRLQAAGQHQAVIELYRQSLTRFEQQKAELTDQASYLRKLVSHQNRLAWCLVMCPDSQLRDPQQAVELSGKMVENFPEVGNFWNTLGAAYYRAGSWKECVNALEKSMQLREGGDAFDWLFLAMAYHQLGKSDEAITWLNKGDDWISQCQQGKFTNPLAQSHWELQHEDAATLRQEAEQLIKPKHDN